MSYLITTNEQYIATTPYTVLETDTIIYVDTNTISATSIIKLPNQASPGQSFTIKDVGGQARNYPITIESVNGLINIDGSSQVVINTAYQSLTIVFDDLSNSGSNQYWVTAGAGGVTYIGQFDSYAFAADWGTNNAFIGHQSGLLTSVTAAANDNAAIGQSSLRNLAGSGQFNVALGSGAGTAYTTTESSNILINHTGIITENNVCRIGLDTGTGVGQLNTTFIAGIAGITTGVDDGIPVLISASTGQLATKSLSNGAVLTKSVTLTSAQIKTLHATPIQLIPAPASGHSNFITSVWSRLNYGGTNVFAAAAAQTIALYYQNAAGASANDWVFSNADIVASANTIAYIGGIPSVTGAAATTTEGFAIVIANTTATEISGNAAGDNTITITVSYYVV